MKKILLFTILQTALFNAFAQERDSVNLHTRVTVNPITDKQEYRGYLIRLKPETVSSYGFDILRNNKPVIRQFQNPLAFSARGIQKKEDAYKIAQWIISQHEKTGHWENMMPPHVARELGIESN